MQNESLILIIEDTPELLSATARALGKAGYQTIEAATGQEGLRLVAERHPELVLVDVVLPDIDGFEVCRRIRRIPDCADCFVVLVSGIRTAASDQIEGLQAIADGYIVRPISNAALVAHVAALGRLQRAQAKLRRASDRLEQRVAQRTQELAQANERLRTEIAERRRTEQALKESEANLRALLNNTDDAIAYRDREGRLVAFNEAFAAIVRTLFDLDLEPGDRIGDRFPPDRREHTEAIRQRVLRGQRHRQEIEWTFPDGSTHIYDLALAPIWQDGRAIGNTEHAREITERVHMVRRLRQSERRFHRYFEMGVVGMAIETPSGAWIDVNQRLCDMLGYTRDELLERHWADLTHPDDLDTDRAQFEALIAGQIERYRIEKRFLRKDGEIIHCLIAVTCSRDREGDVDRVFGCAVDISERVLTETALRRALSDKEALFREVHHRVKNNLAIVSHLLEWQREATDDPDAQRALADSQHRVLSMARVHECLYSTGQLLQVDMADYVAAIGRYLWEAYDAYHVALSLDISEVVLDIDCAIPCGLIVNELLSNALRHAFARTEEPEIATSRETAGNEVQISLHIDDAQVELTISDNGRGLPPDVDLERPESLGMSLVQLFTQQLNGQIAVDRDYGTAFRLTFGLQTDENNR